jgi:hypothetical protein
MPRLATLALLLPLLGGCAVAQAIDDMERQADQSACDGFGFQRGTTAYANCMMQQSAQRAAEDQAAMDRAAWQNAQQQRRNRGN